MGKDAVERLLCLSDDRWSDIVLTLRFHAEFRVRTYRWNSHRRSLPKGWTVDDVVFETISSVLDGTRKPAFEKQDVVEALRSVLDSKVDGLARSGEHWSTDHVENGGAADGVGCLADECGTSAQGANREVDAILSELRQGMAPELIPVFEEMVDGYRPADIAVRLGLPVTTIYTLVRRVRMHVAEVWNKEGAPDGNR